MCSFLASVNAVNPFIKRMNQSQQNRFIDDYIQHVIDLKLEENGKFCTPYKVAIITATK